MNRKSLALAACLVAAPSVASAQSAGMTRVQVIALQQQLKEECGLAHTSGRMDPATRRAVARCNKKYGTKDAWSLGKAMNLGWDAGGSVSSGAGMSSRMSTGSGMSMSGSDMTMHDSTMEMHNVTMRPNRARRKSSSATRSTLSTQADSVLRSDRGANTSDAGMTKKSDTTFSAQSDSLMRASRGIGLPSTPKTKKKN